MTFSIVLNGAIYFDIVVVARGCALKLKGAEGQVDSPVYWHLNGP